MKDIKIIKNIRHWIYTFLLIITCFIASPLIFRQIWKSSKDVEPASSKKPPVIDIKNTGTQPTENIPETESISGDISETTLPVVEEITTEAPPPAPVFVQSDPSYFDDALFIGDSRTVGIYEYGTLKNADYFCSVGLASYKIENEYDANGLTIYDKLSTNNYGKIYIMLGINEVGNDFNYTINSYLNLIGTIKQYQPDAIIYVMANLHVSAIRQAQGDSVTNENLNALNEAQAEFADNETIFYIDVNSIFDDADGNLTAECSNDGVHVLAKYYQDWCDWLCTKTIPVETPDENTDMITTDISSYEFTPETSSEVPTNNFAYGIDGAYDDYSENNDWNY